MAKVNNTEIYPFDDSISPNDYVLGTDGDPTKGLATKNFQISGLINLINAVNGNSSMAFKFQDGSNLATTFLTPGHFFSEFNKITPSTLTKLHLNNKNTQGTIVNNLISLLLNSNLFVLKLVNVADVTNVIYLNTSATILNSGYFSFDVNRFNNLSNGVLVNKDTYIFQFELLNKTVLDKIIQIGEITILNTPNRIKIDTPIDGIWTINGIKHTVLVDTEISITNASAGMFRKDIIVATNLGRYLLIQGVESASNPFSPTIPNNTLLVTEVLVFENRVNETTPPIVGDIYIEKIEKAQVDCVDTGIIDYTFINNRAVVSFTGSVTTLRSANLVVETSYLHKKYTFKIIKQYL